MSGRYKRKPGKRKYRDYSEMVIQQALDSIRDGQTITKASTRFGIPKATLARKVKGQHGKDVGRPRVFGSVDEAAMVEAVTLCAKWGFPLSTFDLKMIVKHHLDRNGRTEPRFKDNTPGKYWIIGFLKRQSNHLTQRFADNLKRARAAVSSETINEYFANLSTNILNVPAAAIINFDETNMTDDPGIKKVLVKRGFKNPKNLIDSSKSSVSVMFAGSASGIMLPSYVVYKSEHLYISWTQGGLDDMVFNRTRSGWFDTKTFEDWFFKIAIPYYESQDLGDVPKVLIGDNLSSHLSIKVIKKCEEENIRLTFLPPNATHLCQPLDLAFFRPLKLHWRNTLQEWKSKNRGTIPKDRFPSLLTKALQNIPISENLKSGFRTAGIYPFNKGKVLEKLPSVVEQNNETESGKEWTKSFENFLNESRLEATTPLRVRKKKVQCPPGQGVTAKDVLSATNFAYIDLEEVIPENELPTTSRDSDSNQDANINHDTDPFQDFGQPSASQPTDPFQDMLIPEIPTTTSQSSSTDSEDYSLHDSSDNECKEEVGGPEL